MSLASDQVPYDSKTQKLRSKLKLFNKLNEQTEESHPLQTTISLKLSKSLNGSPITTHLPSFSSLPYANTQTQTNNPPISEIYSHPHKLNFRLRSNSLPNFNNHFQSKLSRLNPRRRPSQMSSNGQSYSSYSLVQENPTTTPSDLSSGHSPTSSGDRRNRYSPFNSDDSDSIMLDNDNDLDSSHYQQQDAELRDFLKSPSPNVHSSVSTRYFTAYSTASSVSNYKDDELIMIPPLPPATTQTYRPSLSSGSSFGSIPENDNDIHESENENENVDNAIEMPITTALVVRENGKLTHCLSSTSVHSSMASNVADFNTNKKISSSVQKQSPKLQEEDNVDRLANSILKVINIEDKEIKWGI